MGDHSPQSGAIAVDEAQAADLYLDLLKRCLLNLIYEDRSLPQGFDDLATEQEGVLARAVALLTVTLARRGTLRTLAPAVERLTAGRVTRMSAFDRSKRLEGRDFPSQAHTMIGLRRLDNLQELIDDVVASEVPGDLIETGVWRGGATIFMRGVLKARGVRDRRVWVADSFEGMPKPGQPGTERSFDSPEQDASWRAAIRKHPLVIMGMAAQLRRGTSYDEVRDHFERYGLLDEQVAFLGGWFHETLPAAPVERLALMRLDGDLYDSTYVALQALYPKLSVGGYVIIDDYGAFSECRRAVRDYLGSEDTGEVDLQRVDDHAVFWRRSA